MSPANGHEADVKDVEYLRHGDKPLLARLFTPRGSGPFHLVVQLHGGAWCRGDRTNDDMINERLARSGVVVASLDFRMPPDASYPGSMVDINYGVRWLKARASMVPLMPPAEAPAMISTTTRISTVRPISRSSPK